MREPAISRERIEEKKGSNVCYSPSLSSSNFRMLTITYYPHGRPRTENGINMFFIFAENEPHTITHLYAKRYGTHEGVANDAICLILYQVRRCITAGVF